MFPVPDGQTDARSYRIGRTGTRLESSLGTGQRGVAMAKPPVRLWWDRVQELLKLLIGAVEPIAKLIDAISRLR